MAEGEGVLREEELDLLVGKVPQLVAEHIVDADVVSISPARPSQRRTLRSSCPVACGRATRDATVASGQPAVAALTTGRRRSATDRG